MTQWTEISEDESTWPPFREPACIVSISLEDPEEIYRYSGSPLPVFGPHQNLIGFKSYDFVCTLDTFQYFRIFWCPFPELSLEEIGIET